MAGQVNEFAEDLIAELAQLNVLAMTALQAVARTQSDPKAFLQKVLEDGSTAMENTNYHSIPADRKEIVVEKAKARFADAITSIRI